MLKAIFILIPEHSLKLSDYQKIHNISPNHGVSTGKHFLRVREKMGCAGAVKSGFGGV